MVSRGGLSALHRTDVKCPLEQEKKRCIVDSLNNDHC